MSNAQLETAIEAAWETRDQITSATTGEARDAIEDTLNALDSGKLRVAEKQDSGDWHVNQWAKKAVLLGFRIKDMEHQEGGPQGAGWWDKVDSKFKGWGDEQWKAAGFRAVPNCVVRRSAFIAPGAVLMPSFVNIGAYVDSGTMVDTWATVGSWALAAFWNPCRQGPVRGRRRLHRPRRLCAGHGRVHRPVHQDPGPRNRRSDVRRSARRLRCCGRLHALKEQREPLLRRDRETRG